MGAKAGARPRVNATPNQLQYLQAAINYAAKHPELKTLKEIRGKALFAMLVELATDARLGAMYQDDQRASRAGQVEEEGSAARFSALMQDLESREACAEFCDDDVQGEEMFDALGDFHMLADGRMRDHAAGRDQQHAHRPRSSLEDTMIATRVRRRRPLLSRPRRCVKGGKSHLGFP
jgi:hypothetical protein